MSAVTSADREQRGQVGSARVLVSVAAVVTVGVLPVFLLGGLGVQLQAEWGFGAIVLGLGTAGFFAVAALSSRGMGWVAERLGATRAMRVAVAGSSLCLLGLAAARHPTWLITVLWAAGMPNALAQPASNLLIAERIPENRRGTAFGVKQAAIPTAILLSGLAVPAVALTIGWRWAFCAAVPFGVASALSVPRLPRLESRAAADSGDSGTRSGLRALLLIAVAGGLGSAAANALGTFVTTTAVQVGFGPAAAGLVLSSGSAVGVVVRVLVGVAADRKGPDPLLMITVMLLVGSFGYAMMALDVPIPFVVGAMVGFGSGWAWPGLLNFAVARLHPGRVASATSISQTGVYIGGSAGPLLFGLLAQYAGIQLAWLGAGVVAVLASLLLLLARE
ncbi:MFS family permease [Saccharopolyspora lacisalsi]|uniref:MFS family permease n=1 Tax=Halosaccharopolyspora lacisalsi TaxID=1000566 RepID=A0A839E4A5_9PSEU|nr:MFS transporter [Halosaccharopolyspora lacisalsi]MBA8825748.1 MFS family permease [Halosaccharopolyspora lacisalsi]